jgi:hypothetical protein
MRSRLARGLVVAALVAAPIAASTPASAATSRVYGGISGRWQLITSSGADAGQRYHLYRGYGHTNLGVTGASGSSGALGFIRSAPCAISLLLSTPSPKGTMSLRLTSLQEYGAGYPCKVYNFRWKTTKATGAYAGSSPEGTGSVVLQNPPSSGGYGTFKVVLHQPR